MPIRPPRLSTLDFGAVPSGKEVPDKVARALRWPFEITAIAIVAPAPVGLGFAPLGLAFSLFVFVSVALEISRNIVLIRAYEAYARRSLRPQATARWYQWLLVIIPCVLSGVGYVAWNSYSATLAVITDSAIILFCLIMFVRCMVFMIRDRTHPNTNE